MGDGADGGRGYAGRQRLLDAAERLIALHGLEGASLREIVIAAGHRNNSAVTYHFGDRRRLLDAVWVRRTEVINARRVEMLATLDAEGRGKDPRGLAEAYVRPLVDEMTRLQPSYWARFNESWFVTVPLDFLEYLRGDLREADRQVPLSTLDELFNRAVGLVPMPPEAGGTLRVSLIARSVISALAGWEREMEAGRARAEDLASYADQVVELAVAMLTAPAPAAPARVGD